ncbi:response regulator [Kineosporia sp. J2-2]|uniref:Sensor-like histidine kinase SenX3 n=1 Tax=Kineosporia corallincola TaxID=2835133 RepID=A0ABS5TS47_9ACTN|nr:response regulator [Kineosporia corallincola]MBT0773618.1 response regulator [Kineosporia corallincola]
MSTDHPESIGTVLILDDSLTVRMDLVRAFEEAGWRTMPCATVATAWERLAAEPVDCVVLDVVLPDGNGVDVLRQLRTDPGTAALPVLMLSTEAEVQDRIRGLRTGADEYLGKPYDSGYLVARAQELIASGTAVPEAGAEHVVRVLVIDDSPDVRDRFADLLRASGYEVVQADSGLAGLRLAAARRPDAVLVDAELPDIDGATVIRRIRLDSALRGLPCLLLAASEDAGAELTALDAGADAFVGAGTDADVVLAKLSAALRQTVVAGPVVDTASLQRLKKVVAVGSTVVASHAEHLRGEGFDVVQAHTGDEALELLAFQGCDCILIELSADDGPVQLEVCQKVKAAPGVRDVPLIVIGDDDQRQTMVDALAAGADDYVNASADVRVLLARIRAQLQRKQIADEYRQIRESLLRREIEAAQARADAEIAQTKAAMVEELERKNQELEAFSYSVSHDLRSPLRAIDGFTTMLIEVVDEHLDESSRHYADRIRASVKRMNEMIDDLIQLSRVGRAEIARRPVDLATMANEILTDLAAGSPGRQVERSIGDGLTASADARLLRNVLENLLGNAWKFSGQAESPRIEVGRAGNGDFFVRDNGSGFDMSQAGRLFSPFQRLHKQTDFPGTGIGLATVHRIIERHGGRIWAESAPGQGATFWFTLPEGTG